MQSTGQTSTHALSLVPMHGSQMIYATLGVLESGNPGLQPSSITRAVGTASIAMAVLVCTPVHSAAQTAPDRQQWREAPEYVRLLAPASYAAAYRAYVSPLEFDAALRALAADPTVLHPPGAWTAETVHPYDAFGLGGSYNRWKVAGLYKSRRAQVARGPRMDQGVMETVTLIAPYPNADLQRLEPGTLVIVLRIPAELP
jgi:hypothetical protein